MDLSADNLRFILGLKLRTLRQQQGSSLKEIAARSGLSISYLSEIEKGKKYPKPDKLIDLAQAFDVPFDELVSMRVTEELAPLKSLFSSSFVQEFPFELFGLTPEDLFGLVTDEPDRAGALIRTFLEVGRLYDVQVEHFLFAALRSYQEMNRNYFDDLEEAARAFRSAHGWDDGPVDEATLRRTLEEEHGYTIDLETLPAHPVLHDLRSVYAGGDTPRLLVNGRLLPSQRAFVYARELGYLHLGLEERVLTSSWVVVDSFDEVLNNFKASYFAGAVLIERDALRADLEAFFARPTWDGEALVRLVDHYHATPEMLLYRLTELIPALFGLKEIYFMRFNNRAGTERFVLSKVFNMSRVPVPHGIGLGEHYCRRWPAMKLLNQLAARQAAGQPDAQAPAVTAQRSRFLDEDAEFFVLSLARPLALTEGTNSCVSLGFVMNDAFKQTVRFWDDPALPQVDVNLTCERCPLSERACLDRVAPATIHAAHQAQTARVEALEALLGEQRG